jgi:2-oxoglutarate dehydrogenase complex dehydrogenase (E1) component-like enzyme
MFFNNTLLIGDLQGAPIRYVGRAASASTATGDKYEHVSQHEAVLELAFA